mgnify:CR=1 FL=1
MSETNPHQRGLILIISGPSGCGKDTVSDMLSEKEPYIERTVTTTSREKRKGEVEGRDYNYIDRETFEEKITEGYFLEYNEFVGNYYGVPRGPVEEKLAKGRDVIFVIDWNGARKLKAAMPEDVVSIFLLPPSLQDLRERLENRGREEADVIEKRINQGKIDITHYDEYDYVVLNDDLESVMRRFQRILRAERLRRYRQPWLGEFVKDLLAGEKPSPEIIKVARS